jgi:hypothetical protein
VAIRGRCGPATSLGAVAKSASRASERGIALELIDVVRRAKAVHVGDVAVVDVCVALLRFCVGGGSVRRPAAVGSFPLVLFILDWYVAEQSIEHRAITPPPHQNN